MTTQYQARVLDVTEIRSGSEVIMDTPMGSFTLSLYDVSDFNDEGGQVEIDGTVYGYLSKDDEADTITLGTPTVMDYTADEEVYLYPATIDKEAMVQIDEEDAVMARVPYALYDALATIVRDEVESEAVTVVNEDGDWVIKDVLGSRMVRDGDYLAPGSVDESQVGPTAPPLTSPTPTLTGNIRTILGKFDAVFNAARYNLYLSDTDQNPPDATHYAGTILSNQFQLDEVPVVMETVDAETGQTSRALRPGVTYYVSIVALNDLDAAPPSPWVGVELRPVTGGDISATYAYLGEVTFDQMSGGEFSSTVVWTGKLSTRQSETQAGAEIDPTSYRGFGLPPELGAIAPLIFEVPFDGRPAFFAGDVQARKFTAYQGTEFYGDANNIKADGGFFLESGSGGSVPPPKVVQSVPSVALTKPSRTTSWGKTVTFDVTQCFNFTWDVLTSKFVTAQNTPGGVCYWNIGLDGVVTATTDQAEYRSGGYVRANNGLSANFISYNKNGNTVTWGLFKNDGWWPGVYTAMAPGAVPSIGVDQDGAIRIAEVIPGSGGQVRVQRFTVPINGKPTSNGVNTLPPMVGAGGVASVQYGQFDLGSGDRYVIASRRMLNSTIRVTVPNTLQEDVDANWGANDLIGLSMNAQASASAAPGTARWYAIASNARLYMFGANTWPNSQSSRHVVGITMATGTAESQVGEKVPFTALKRNMVTVTAPALISPATRIGIYMWRGSTGLPIDAQMIRQGYSADGTMAATLTSISYSGSAPGGAPTASPYPLSSPAYFRSQGFDARGNLINLKGDGSFRLGWLDSNSSGRRTYTAIVTPTTVPTTLNVSGAWKLITFPNTFEYGGVGFTMAGSAVSITESGLYFVSLSGEFENNPDGRRLLMLESFTTEAVAAGRVLVYDEIPGAGVVTQAAISTDVYLAAGTKVRMAGYQSSGVPLDVRAGARMTLRKVG